MVRHMIKSADGGTGLLHKITMPAAERRSADSGGGRGRCQALGQMRGEEKNNGQYIGSATRRCKKTEDKPWRNDELRSMEEGMQSFSESDLEKAARNYKVKTGVAL